MPAPPRKNMRKPKGLNSKERREVSKIAKSAVQTSAEKKFLNSEQYLNQSFNSANSVSPLAVLGYSTTDDLDQAGAVINYGGISIMEGLCLRPYYSSDTDEAKSAWAIVGKKILPRKCHTRMRIVRKYGVMNNDQNTIPVLPSPSVSPPPLLQSGLAKNLPIQFRVIRVTPKIPAGTTATLNPEEDLFQSFNGSAIGVASPAFKEEEILFCRVNNRKYQTLSDSTFSLQNPLTIAYTFTKIANSNDGHYLAQISNTNNNCEKYLNFNHQLTDKKNKPLFYNDITDGSDGEDPTINSTVGQRREYVFIHAFYKGSTSLVGHEADRTLNPSDQLKMNLYNQTTFTDI